MQQGERNLNIDSQSHNTPMLRGGGAMSSPNGEQRRRLEEVSYWRKRAGWYDDGVNVNDDFVPASVTSGRTNSYSGGSGVQSSMITRIVGGVVLLVVMVVLAKQFASVGGSRRSSSSEDERGRTSSSSRSRSRSKSRTRGKSLSRSRSRSRARDSDTKRSRSRSRSTKKVTDEYNLMEENSSKVKSPSRTKMMV